MAVAERSTAVARCPRSGTDIRVSGGWLRQGRWAVRGFSLARSALGPSRRLSIQPREPGYREDRAYTPVRKVRRRPWVGAVGPCNLTGA
jgi:hypothetical protein